MSDSELSGPGITIVGGLDDGAVLALSTSVREYRLGSTPNCELHVDLGNVDALHARLTIDGTRLLLSDAGSATGTYVNGERTGPLHELHDGDRISLGPPGSKGSARLLVHLPEGSFTTQFPSARRPAQGASRAPQEEGGLAPFSGGGLSGEGPWSLLPPRADERGLELSNVSDPLSSFGSVLPEAPSATPSGPTPSGLELSGSPDPLFSFGDVPSADNHPFGTGPSQAFAFGADTSPTPPPGPFAGDSRAEPVDLDVARFSPFSPPPLPPPAFEDETVPPPTGEPSSFGANVFGEPGAFNEKMPGAPAGFGEPSPSEPPFGAAPEQPPLFARDIDASALALGHGQAARELALPLPNVHPSPGDAFPPLFPPPMEEPAAPSTPAELQPARRMVPPVPTLPDTLPPPPSITTQSKPTSRPEYSSELPSITPSALRRATPAPEPPHEPRTHPALAPRRRSRRRGGGFSFTPSPQLLLALGVIAGIGALYGTFVLLRPLFRKPPVSESLAPGRVQPGQTLTITGANFDSTPAGNTVTLGALGANVTAATPTQISVTVPANAAPGGPVELAVVVTTATGPSRPLKVQVYRAPRMTSVEPDVVMPGEEVVVRGENLDGKPLVLSFSGMAAEVRETSPSSLKAVVPSIPTSPGGSASVALSVGPDSAPPTSVLIGRLPLILRTEPASGATGDRIRIKGRGFAPEVSGNSVVVGTERVLILGASPTELTVVVPATPTGFASEVVPIQVSSRGATSSNPATFTISRPSAGSFVPRFFATPAPDAAGPGAAIVSCELGPVFAFGARGDDPSTAERAVRVASELNALFEQALLKKLSVELVDKPLPAITVGGSSKPLLSALPEDAAVYPRLGEATARNKAPSQRALATLWAALLRDSLSLFAYRERPILMLEQSVRARTFADLYSETLRTAGRGAGVPNRVVLPLPPSLARSFREMTMQPAPDAGSRPGAAVEGRWDGTMESDGSRVFQLRLRLEGSRLSGAVTSEAGKLSMNTPVRDAVYEKGKLRFVVDLYGSPRLFSGTVTAETIEGTIERAGGDKARLGTFTLRYVE